MVKVIPSSSLLVFLISLYAASWSNASVDADGDWTGRWKGWKNYLQKFDPSGIWSNSGERFVDGDGKMMTEGKPSYLYSGGSIRELASIEGDIYAAVKDYSGKLEERLNLLKTYMKDYEDSSVNMMKIDEPMHRDYALLASPILAHRIIRRFAIDIPSIQNVFQSKPDLLDGEGLLEALDAANPGRLAYPTIREDYNQSLYSLLRIQQYSNLDTMEIANGQLGHLKTGVGFDSRHAFELGVYAGILNPPAYSLAIEWVEMALDMVEHEGIVDPEHKEVIEQELEELVLKHDAYCSADAEYISGMENCFAYTINDLYGSKRPVKGSAFRVKASYRNQLQSDQHRNETGYSGHTRRNFLSTCSGRSLQSEKEKSRLNCWYEMKNHPYLRISPFKMELLNELPPVYQIYDVLGSKRREALIRMATPNLERSVVVNNVDPTASDVVDSRTSMQTWIYDDDVNHAIFLDGISRQIEYITGLNVRKLRHGNPSEAYQIANYRTSHHYDEHLDAFSDERRARLNGNRLATVMFYLTDVDVGGMTGFPNMGTAAKPIAGSAIFWHNLWKNGTVDKRTYHGGCPVVHGMKWVVNKWILSNENFDKRLCSLNREE